jgi:glutamine amidotransferase
MPFSPRRPTAIAAALAGLIASGCAGVGSGLTARRTTVGTLKADVARLEHQNEQYRSRVAELEQDRRRISEQLAQEREANGELAARLDDARMLLARQGGASEPAETTLPSRDAIERIAPPSSRSRSTARKPPFAQIGTARRPLPAPDDEDIPAPGDVSEQDRTPPPARRVRGGPVRPGRADPPLASRRHGPERAIPAPAVREAASRPGWPPRRPVDIMARMIAIIDYGMGNLRSVQKALEAVGSGAEVTCDPDRVRRADKVILPGVGAFDDAIAELRRTGLAEAFSDAVQAGTPCLGVCLGLQLLFDVSEEDGLHQGLGLIPGRVVRFPDRPGLKVPHMGWNTLRIRRPAPLLAGIGPEPSVYFVHSYYAQPDDSAVIAAEADYPDPFAAMVWRDNLTACQFHPEKSQRVGLAMYANFAAI